jgi:hypothetical protein
VGGFVVLLERTGGLLADLTASDLRTLGGRHLYGAKTFVV